MTARTSVIIVGAGIGGLAAALLLSHAGLSVTVLERQPQAGGKIRTVDSGAGPVDAGPTVLTLRPVFEELFRDVGARLSDHVTMSPLDLLARHYWSDGTLLDLQADAEASAANIALTFGLRSVAEFRAYRQRAATLYEAFESPVMWNPAPSRAALTALALRRPALTRAMAPQSSLAQVLQRQFREPKLAQLFGRYATYVGGSPALSPALLALIWHAEASGVWHVAGGLQALPRAIEALARERGATFHYDVDVTSIVRSGARSLLVRTKDGDYPADAVLFNGDPMALHAGLLGTEAKFAVPAAAVLPRSHSACVLAFAARVRGPALAHHTVFFGDSPNAEFDFLAQGDLPRDPTLYVCAQDRDGTEGPDGPERFEIILNAPAGKALSEKEKAQCLTALLSRLGQFGVGFDPAPTSAALTTPMEFDQLFPGSQGALYGRAPHGLMAAFARPTARSQMKGLYLAGGGTHPGPGVPMATLSGRHAAEAILQDLTSVSMSPETATRGGMSTASATRATKPFLSSAS